MTTRTNRCYQSRAPTLRVWLPPQVECKRNVQRMLHRVSIGPRRRLPPEVLTDAEVCALMRACGRYAPTGLRNRALIALLYRAGLRINEALSLYPKDLELADGCIRVLHGKGGRSRTVGLDPGAAAIIERWLDARSRCLAVSLSGAQKVFGNSFPSCARKEADYGIREENRSLTVAALTLEAASETLSHDVTPSRTKSASGRTLPGAGPSDRVVSREAFGRQPVFCTLRGQPMSDAYVRRLLKRLAARAGIEKRVHAHGLRHTHAAQLRAEGIDIAIISRQLGHTSITTTACYLDHLAPTAVIDAMRRRTWTGE